MNARPVFEDKHLIAIGYLVKSYDFPDSPPDRREQCYKVGVVQAVGTFDFPDGVQRYKIAVSDGMFGGNPIPKSELPEFVYAPVNGTPIAGGGFTMGVETTGFA